MKTSTVFSAILEIFWNQQKSENKEVYIFKKQKNLEFETINYEEKYPSVINLDVYKEPVENTYVAQYNSGGYTLQ